MFHSHLLQLCPLFFHHLLFHNLECEVVDILFKFLLIVKFMFEVVFLKIPISFMTNRRKMERFVFDTAHLGIVCILTLPLWVFINGWLRLPLWHEVMECLSWLLSYERWLSCLIGSCPKVGPHSLLSLQGGHILHFWYLFAACRNQFMDFLCTFLNIF